MKSFACDFETSVYAGQNETEVWAFAICEVGTENVMVFNHIKYLFSLIDSFTEKCVLYFHNLKFDGSFILDYALRKSVYSQAYTVNEKEYEVWKSDKEMPKNSMKYLISEMGLWYSFTIKNSRGVIIEIRDSLKLLPFSIEKIGKDFKTKHQKLSMEYVGERHAGCDITDEEKKYIENDVLVLSEALEIMFNRGHHKMTIGSCALTEYKTKLSIVDYKLMFPQLDEFYLDPKLHSYNTVYEWLHTAYRGAWCFVSPKYQRKLLTTDNQSSNTDKILINGGQTADVNSLYPSIMHSKSGNPYPTGNPRFFVGDIPDKVTPDKYFIYIRFSCKFMIKDGYLPFIQIKNNYLYDGREMLYSSRVYSKKDGCVYDDTVTLTMPYFEYELMQQHYIITDFKMIDGCYFQQAIGLFDMYIDHWFRIKQESTGSIKAISKLMLNSLYGKFATSPDSSYKVAWYEDDEIKFRGVPAQDMKCGYIAIGAAITAYARRFTILHAQANVDRFCYADTDSIHCIGLEPLNKVKIHDSALLHWKIESTWQEAYFVRAKCYIEHDIKNDNYIIRCAGLPENCKDMLEMSLRSVVLTEDQKKEYEKEEIEFIETPRTIDKFDLGILIPSKLRPKRIKGGIILEKTTFNMRKNIRYF